MSEVAELSLRIEAKRRSAIPYSDFGNAERLVAEHGADLRYVPGPGWHVWDGSRWRLDDDGAVMRRAKATARAMKQEAARLEGKPSDALFKHALKSEGRARLEATVALAQSEEPVIVRVEALDADRFLLNVENGTLDLRTGKLREPRRDDLLTKLAPVTFDPVADCPTWLAFLDRIFAEDGELIAFVQRLTGYALTGDASEQVLLILHGVGMNGKSVLTETLLALLGEYAATADSETFTANRGHGIPNDLASLRGARYVKVVETEAGATLALQLVKKVTGQDTVKARFLYKEWFEFRPQFKLILVTNHLPRIPAEDVAAWRRIRLVPFDVRIPHGEQDRHLLDKLRAELPGILNWAAEGCLRWQADGLGVPPAVAKATRAYKERQDSVARFIKECCHHAADAAATPSELWDAYFAYCKQEGCEPVARSAFRPAVEEHGFRQDRNMGGRWWAGIGVGK